MDYNRAVEQAYNENLFLNIVRSVKHHPKHFTEVTKITGTESRAAKLGLGVPFGGGSTDLYNLSTEVSGSAGPTYEIGILHTDKFTRGITQPVDTNQIKSFADQGWPLEFLLMLFVRDIEVGTFDNAKQLFTEESRVFNSYCEMDGAQHEDNIKAFYDILDSLVKGGLTLKTRPSFSATIGDAERKDIIKTEAFLKGEVRIVNDGPPFILESTKDKAYFSLAGPDEGAQTSTQAQVQMQVQMVVEHQGKAYQFRLRSPEAVIYYLGEVMRIELEPHQEWRPVWRYWEKARKSETPEGLVLFYARKKLKGDPQSFLEVKESGIEYSVPSSGLVNCAGESADTPPVGKDTSMTTLSFLTLLLDMNKTRDELPTTGLVQVVGPK